ncbi:MAG: hypothetical protein Q8S71_03870 [Hydrogenophaga sp.]|nr:hypothetical protein [Hydrogenophaga sp.]
MQTAQTDLETAFKSSRLPLMGYTFEAAISNHALAICLNRLAQRKEKALPEPKPVKRYWYQEI